MVASDNCDFYPCHWPAAQAIHARLLAHTSQTATKLAPGWTPVAVRVQRFLPPTRVGMLPIHPCICHCARAGSLCLPGPYTFPCPQLPQEHWRHDDGSPATPHPRTAVARPPAAASTPDWSKHVRYGSPGAAAGKGEASRPAASSSVPEPPVTAGVGHWACRDSLVIDAHVDRDVERDVSRFARWVLCKRCSSAVGGCFACTLPRPPPLTSPPA